MLAHPISFKKKKKNTTRLKSADRPNTLIVEDFNSPLSPIDPSSKGGKKINKETSEILGTISQMNLTDIC
jgi:hypothetical protein